MTPMEQYIRDYSASIGLNPDVVMQTVLAEGGRSSLSADPARQSLIRSGGRQEQSYGPFQMNMAAGALGDRALKAGFDPRDPSQAFNVARFAMDTMKKEGLGAWRGWKGDPWAAAGGSGTGANVAQPSAAFVSAEGPKGQEHWAQPYTPADGPKGQEAWAPPAGGPANIAVAGGQTDAWVSPYSLAARDGKKDTGLAAMAKAAMNAPGKPWQLPQIEPTPGAARIDAPTAPVLDTQAAAQRQLLAQMILARLNQGSLG